MEKDFMREIIHEKIKESEYPLFITDSKGLAWIVVVDEQIHVLGPSIVRSEIISSGVHNLVKEKKSRIDIERLTSFVDTIPGIPVLRLVEYAVMFYFTVKEREINISDLQYINMYADENNEERDVDKKAEEALFYASFRGEKEMMRIVREGDVEHLEKHMSKLSKYANIDSIGGTTNERKWKNTLMVGVVLFSRAAIEGGLPPDVSLHLSNHYIRCIEESNSFTELMELSRTMQRDYVKRVRNAKQEPSYSEVVRACCNYIDYHLEDPISLKGLASELGYAEYYLSKKFKRETGKTVSRYLNEKRLDRAKYFLSQTNMAISDISDLLHFNSQSYFTDRFRKEFGITPALWREQNYISDL
ncbi:MAG: AraC family transcriptional regulator [Lachnospiraceae bacterium]|nr:AraC family transcriptional regulator [Lachnospiraceae bacterium]